MMPESFSRCAIAALLLTVVSTIVRGQEEPAAVSKVRTYLAAFNGGDAAALAGVLDTLYSPTFLGNFGGARAAAWERLELRRTYGPLTLVRVDTTVTPAIVWTQGTVSRGWVGHQLYLAPETGKVTRHSIWRARPIGYPRADLSRRQIADSMRSYLDALARAGLFSGSATLSQRGEMVFRGSWGSDGSVQPSPVRGNTRFHIASVTKLFTAVAILQAVQAGRVGLGDSIGRWIPEYPAPYRDEVRVRHLLTHTSGIELDDDAEYLALTRIARGPAELLAAQIRYIAGRPPRFKPGSEYDYSSEGIDLLAVILERATNRSWPDVVRKEILRPAGIADTRFAVPLEDGHWALGFTSLAPDLQSTIPGALRPALDVLTQVAKPSSGLWSTSDDLHRFMRALLDHRLLNAAWTDSLLSPKLITGDLPKYGIESWVGLGAQGEDLWGTRTVGHGGVVPGYSAAIEYVPSNGWLLTVVSNTGEATGFLVFQRFLELVAAAP